MLTQEEIEKSIISAKFNLEWDYEGNLNSGQMYYGTQLDWNETIVTNINVLASKIFKETDIHPNVHVSHKNLFIVGCESFKNINNDNINYIGKICGLNLFTSISIPSNVVLIGNEKMSGIITISNLF